jgi:hypothetical protein
MATTAPVSTRRIVDSCPPIVYSWRSSSCLLDSAPQGEPPPVSTVSYPNDNDTVKKFRFRRDQGPEEGQWHQVHIPQMCQRRVWHQVPKHGLSERTQNNTVSPEPHNHPPPPNPHVRPEIREKATIQLSAGASPALVHRQIMNDAPLPLSPAEAPTQRQLIYWKR